MSNFFYPHSNIWVKRLRYLMVLCTVSLNLFVGDIQTRILMAGQTFVTLADTVSGAGVASIDNVAQGVKAKVEALRSRDHWLAMYLPKFDGLDKSVDRLKVYQDGVHRLVVMLDWAAMILKIGSWVMWVSIGRASLWLMLDLLYGRTKRFVITALVLVGGFNLIVDVYLHSILENTNSIF